jgi:hypothetical protein
MKAKMGSKGIALLFLEPQCSKGLHGKSHASMELPLGMNQYPLYRKLGEPQDQYVQVQKNSVPPGFDSQTVQPVESHHTNSAMPAHQKYKSKDNIKVNIKRNSILGCGLHPCGSGQGRALALVNRMMYT